MSVVLVHNLAAFSLLLN